MIEISIMLCMLSLLCTAAASAACILLDILRNPSARADRHSCRGPPTLRLCQRCRPCGSALSQSPCTSMQSLHACQRPPGAAVSLGDTSSWRHTRACTRQACGIRFHSSLSDLVRSSRSHAQIRCRATTEDAESTDDRSTHKSDIRQVETKQRRRNTDSPDFISSALTRRFG